ncbi:HSP-70 cofactor [Anaerohalosphaera lusitana]|uniref:Protein GrpE n=1 Tax=Anaerohalosphaera lusitana TaxID=1936003 RepID=A0A1U9NQP3_9BACT|nr:nucleotide exchange factor GrpE [Anaerohalosphaera lusitana]AQT70252.1 HSP-70 cofactor [Anaerohalosphaera lusitana]
MKDEKQNKDKEKSPKSSREDKKAAKKVEQLEEQIEKLEHEKSQLFEQLQRVSADYANFQKRAPKQIADSVAYEKKAIIKSLLPSLDNFGHALAGLEDADENVKNVLQGVKLVFDHMLDALRAHGVEQIDALGEQFNPSQHEALMQRFEEDKPDNVVVEEYQKGYALNGQVIRPSKVIVNKRPEETEDTEEVEKDLPAEDPQSGQPEEE